MEVGIESIPDGARARRGAGRAGVRGRDQRLQRVYDTAQGGISAEKLDQLLQHEERILERERRTAFNTAFAQLQVELPAVTERGTLAWPNGRTSTYALWEDINEAMKPLLYRHGFSLLFTIEQDASSVTVKCELRHTSGECAETAMRLPLDFSDGKSGVQAVGSATSYGKRYTASALLNITTIGDDTDGSAPVGGAVDQEQLASLQLAISRYGVAPHRLAALFDVARLEDLPSRCFSAAMAAIRAKGARP